MSKMVIVNNLKEDLERINKNIAMYESKISKCYQGI
jgi:chaperonin cofactor prefoldin